MTSERDRSRRAVLLDLDGTLVDTNYLHTICWWQALRDHGRTVPMATIHRSVGMGADTFFDHVLGQDRRKGDDEAMSSAHAAYFAAWHGEVSPLPGARSLVRRCAELGYTVVIASSATQENLRALGAVLDVDEYVTAATSSKDAKRSKPYPDIVRVSLDRVGVDPRDAVFVGDSVWDVQAAQPLGVACVGLECGGTSAGELRAAGAVETWRDPADLLEHLDTSVLTLGREA